jgi:hypothetical protein
VGTLGNWKMKLLEACGAKNVSIGSLCAFGLSSRPFRFQGPEADGRDLRGRPALGDLFVCFVAPARWLQIRASSTQTNNLLASGCVHFSCKPKIFSLPLITSNL